MDLMVGMGQFQQGTRVCANQSLLFSVVVIIKQVFTLCVRVEAEFSWFSCVQTSPVRSCAMVYRNRERGVFTRQCASHITNKLSVDSPEWHALAKDRNDQLMTHCSVMERSDMGFSCEHFHREACTYAVAFVIGALDIAMMMQRLVRNAYRRLEIVAIQVADTVDCVSWELESFEVRWLLSSLDRL